MFALGLVVFTSVLLLSIGLTQLKQLGKPGQQLTQFLCQAPGIDIALVLLMVGPWLVGTWTGGWLGVFSALLGQILASQVWVLWHGWLYRASRPAMGINSYLSQRYGWWRNHLALWITAVVLPVFFLIRAAQIVIYPCLVKLLGFKAYDHSEWINVSRHRFGGLVGHDLLWCLYCDWMTGVYSLGAEMLRNVESFWCPIRFYSHKKCENCSLDFPDIDRTWVAPDGSMQDVVQTLQDKIPGDRPWTWSERD